jgi:hypothetical protein
MILTHTEIDTLFQELESRFAVDEWMCQGFHVWPLVRMRIYWICAVLLGESAQQSSCFNTWKTRVIRELGSAAKLVEARLRDNSQNVTPQSVGLCDVALLSDGVSFTKLGGKHYERFCDPIEEFYASQGVRTFKLTPGTPLLPRCAPSMLIGPRLRCIRGAAALQSRRQPAVAPPQGFEPMAQWLHERCGFSLRWSTFQHEAFLVRQYSRFYKKVLKVLQAKLGFVVSYYANEGFAFCLACRELGIPTVEIQHGVQGALHPAYGGWRRVPIDGYEVVPQKFLVWSKIEGEAIRRWTESLGPTHGPLVTGNLFLQLCQAEQLPLVSQLGGQVRPLVNQEAIQVLYTLSYLESPSDIADMLATIARRDRGRRLQWWVRVHPAGLHRFAELQRAFAAAGVPAPQLQLATDLPLYALLPYMDVHVTGASSTVLEAESFGVRSVLVRPLGAELYPEQIASGIALHAEGEDDILRAIRQQSELKRQREELRASAEQNLAKSRRILDELYAWACGSHARGGAAFPPSRAA